MKINGMKCPNCGANLKINNNSNEIICEYCNQTVIVEDTVATYGLKVSGNINVDGIETNLDLITAANELMDMGEYLRAKKKFLEFSEKCPDKYQGWLGLLICRTRNFTIRDNNILFENDIKKYYDHFLRTAPLEVKEDYLELLESYMFPERVKIQKAKERLNVDVGELKNNVVNSRLNDDNTKSIENNSMKKNHVFDYIMVVFCAFVVMGSISDGMIFSLIFWILNLLIFLPKTRESIINKFENLDKYIKPIKIILPIVSFVILAVEVPDLYEDTWIASDGMVVNLEDGKANIVLIDGREIITDYSVVSDSSSGYVITVLDNSNNIDYTFRYSKDDDIITFCLVEDDNCSVYFKPENPNSSYEYNY